MPQHIFALHCLCNVFGFSRVINNKSKCIKCVQKLFSGRLNAPMLLALSKRYFLNALHGIILLLYLYVKAQYVLRNDISVFPLNCH